MDKIVNQYCSDVLSDKIPAGLHLKNAVKRYLCDRKNGWVYDEKAVDKTVKFISKLKHFTGKHAGKYFELEPWQLFIIANLYGFYNQDGSRRFQTAYLEMARKQGKTALVSTFALEHLVSGEEADPEILLAANSKDQAKIDFKMVYNFSHGYDPKEKTIKRYRADVILRDKPGFIKCLAADSDKLDGYNCSLGIVDEYHSAPNSQVRDVIRSSQGMRINPMLLTITTAGFDKSLPCFELRTVCSEIIAGVKRDDSFFGVIYSLDEKDDWRDPEVWPKSNPNLNVTVELDFLQKQVQQAINSPGDEVGVKTKNLNVWCDSATTWIPDEYILKASQKLKIDSFQGEDCYMGVDLSSNVDLTAVSYLFVRDEKYHFITNYYIPIDTLKIRDLHADKELYKQWVMMKYLKTTAGNVVDYSYITADILENSKKCDIKNIYYDRYNSTQWAIECTEEGLPLEPFSQTINNFNICTKEFERLILCGKIVIDDNPITRYCLRNVELRYDVNRNAKPNRSNEKRKIDGVISMLQALAVYIDASSNYKGTNLY